MSVGLSLGDFCGVVAVAREEGGEEVIANADGERSTPTAVGFGEEGVVVSLGFWFPRVRPWLFLTPTCERV
jgi:molecular chaperone DnaK (HSP70)